MYRKAECRWNGKWSAILDARSIQHDSAIVVNGDGVVVLLSDLSTLGNLFGLGFSSIQISVCGSTLGG